MFSPVHRINDRMEWLFRLLTTEGVKLSRRTIIQSICTSWEIVSMNQYDILIENGKIYYFANSKGREAIRKEMVKMSLIFDTWLVG